MPSLSEVDRFVLGTESISDKVGIERSLGNGERMKERNKSILEDCQGSGNKRRGFLFPYLASLKLEAINKKTKRNEREGKNQSSNVPTVKDSSLSSLVHILEDSFLMTGGYAKRSLPQEKMEDYKMRNKKSLFYSSFHSFISPGSLFNNLRQDKESQK